MLYIIIAIIAIYLLWGILKKVGTVLAYVVGGIVLLSLAVYIIREHGMLLLKIAAIGAAAIVLLAILFVLKEIIDIKRYKKWIDTVGIGANERAPGGQEARDKVIERGQAVRIGEAHTAAVWFCQKLKKELQNPPLFVYPLGLWKMVESLCGTAPKECIQPLMKYLDGNGLLLAVSSPDKELCGISPAFFEGVKEEVNLKGMVTTPELQELLGEKYSGKCAKKTLVWLTPEFLRLLAAKGDVEIIPSEGEVALFKATAPAAQCEMTVEELSYEELMNK